MSSGKTLREPNAPGTLKTVEAHKVRDLESPSFEVGYHEHSKLENLLQSGKGSILGVVSYGKGENFLPLPHCPHISINLVQVSDPPLIEVWTSPLPVHYSRDKQIHSAMNGQILFGFLELEESDDSSLDRLTYEAYARVLQFVRNIGYPNLIRMWNHFSAINTEQNGMERYKQFCAGRHRAFLEQQVDFTRILPAATAVGTRSGPLQIYFIAGKQEGTHFENPRQVSAYKYPPPYGPLSPAFARGTLHENGSCRQFFIAGTSSIVGHESQHHGNPSEQTKETLRNLDTLMDPALVSRGLHSPNFEEGTLLKVFVRHHQDFNVVQQALGSYETRPHRILYLQGDMCRRELLVEIEGIFDFF